MAIRCIFLEDTGEAQVYLRRYAEGTDCTPKDGYPTYHNAKTPIATVPYVFLSDKGRYERIDYPEVSHDDSRWPSQCEVCDYLFTQADAWQLFYERISVHRESGQRYLLHEAWREGYPFPAAPPGAMWWARWLDDVYHPQLAHTLMLRTPGGDICLDSQASNCTIPDDHNQERHHCWVLHGSIPNVTADKSGVTCQAGAGSILIRNWHGFLRDGYLTE